MSENNPFRIDVLDASGNLLAAGAITEILSVATVSTLDKMDSMTFLIPAGSAGAEFVVAGRQYEFFDDIEGFVGRFLHRKSEVTDASGRGILRVECDGIMQQLNRQSVYFNREYDNVPLNTVIDDLLSLVEGWSATFDSTLPNTQSEFQGQSVLGAINALRERFGLHLRAGLGRIVEIGKFGESSGLLFSNLRGQPADELEANLNIAVVSKLSIAEDDSQVFNRIIAIGAGQGAAKTTMEGATAGVFALQTGQNKDGSDFNYVEDVTSINRFGLREKVLSVTTVRPLNNSTINTLGAADELKLAAEAVLVNSSVAQKFYDADVSNLRAPIKPGQTLRLRYVGQTEENIYIDEDVILFALEIVRQRNVVGNQTTRTAKVIYSNILEPRRSNSDVIVSSIKAIREVQDFVQPTAMYFPDTYYDYAQAHPSGSSFTDKEAVFKLEIDERVLLLVDAQLRFKTRVLYTMANISSAGGNNYNYMIIPDNQFPSDVHLLINGLDVSSNFGGPWNVGGANAALDITANITSLLLNEPGGFRQDHDIRIMVIRPGVQRPINVPTYNATTADASHGQIEMNFRVLGIAQAIQII